MQNYFYRDKASQEIGPLPLDALAKLRFAGVLDGDTPVRDADSTEWKPCREIIADPSHPMPSQTVTAPVAKSPFSPVLVTLIILGLLVYGGMTLYKSVAVKTTLTYDFSLDGEVLSALQQPEVKLDGQLFESGDHLKPGKHEISIRLENVEPYKQHFWVFYENKNLGTLPLEYSKGGVDLSADSSDAEYELSGNGLHWQGKLPAQVHDVRVGAYRLTVVRKGWKFRSQITVSRNGITTNKTEFPYGSIEVTSDPTGMTVLTNGVEIGKTPMTLQELIPGQYTLTVTDRENELTADAIVSVGPKEAAKHAFVFHYGTVQLSSKPAGATVIRKEKEVGKTPLTLNHIPVGKSSVELRLDGYVSTNLLVGVSEGATANLSVKLISEQYLQAMKKAHDAFDAGQFADSRIAIAAALAVEPDDPDAVKLQAKIADIEQNAEKVRLEAEKKASMEKRFNQLTASIPDSGLFAIYSREYSSDFDKVWNAVINILKQQNDTIASSNPQNGLIITDLTKHAEPLPLHYNRYLILVERSGGNTTKVNLKLMRFWQSFVGDHDSQEILRPSGQMQGGVVERQANGFLDNIGQELNAR